MPPDCSEHRKTMELLALRIQLERGVDDPVRLEEIRRRIEALEEELKLD